MKWKGIRENDTKKILSFFREGVVKEEDMYQVHVCMYVYVVHLHIFVHGPFTFS